VGAHHRRFWEAIVRLLLMPFGPTEQPGEGSCSTATGVNTRHSCACGMPADHRDARLADPGKYQYQQLLADVN